jgi:hypothetical protein
VDTRTCTKCGNTHPCTGEFFRPRGARFTTRCRECERRIASEYRATRSNEDKEQHQTYMAKWREEHPSYMKDWYVNHPEAKEVQREWARKNPDKIRKYQETYYERFPDKKKEKQRRYRVNQPEASRRRSREYYRRHPETARAAWRRRRAALANVESSPYTTQMVLDLYGTDCYLCTEPIDLTAPRRAGIPGWELGLHIEHVVPITADGPDTLDNVRPSHGRCNLSKGPRPYNPNLNI